MPEFSRMYVSCTQQVGSAPRSRPVINTCRVQTYVFSGPVNHHCLHQHIWLPIINCFQRPCMLHPVFRGGLTQFPVWNYHAALLLWDSCSGAAAIQLRLQIMCLSTVATVCLLSTISATHVSGNLLSFWCPCCQIRPHWMSISAAYFVMSSTCLTRIDCGS